MEITELLKQQKEEKAKAQKLTKTETAMLLNCLKNSTFRGQDLEAVYNLVLKLQDIYVTVSQEEQ